MWVKVCGNTSLADALLAAEAGADAVGFVFAPSPRQVYIEQVAPMTKALPTALEKIGVFVGATAEQIAEAVRACGLTGVQLHGGDPTLAENLRQQFGPGLRILGVAHFSKALGSELEMLASQSVYDALLVDSRTATQVGGTGVAYDWQAAAAILQRSSSSIRLVAAGGLKPDNVAEAIRVLAPWGVDVASGVEQSPGRKDPERVREFIRKARTAAGVADCRAQVRIEQHGREGDSNGDTSNR